MVVYNALDPFNAAIPRFKRDGPDRKADRAKEAKAYQWKDIETVFEIKEGPQKGWQVAYISNPYDLAYLGHVCGHCAGTHWIWACEEKTWYFFALLDDKGVPKDTVHCKWEKWLNKPHPRDPAQDYDYEPAFPPEVHRAIGTIPQDPEKGIFKGGYTTLPQVEAAFKSLGLEYEPGKYKATFRNAAYGGGYKEDASQYSWDRLYERYTLRDKPAQIDQALWDQYTKLMQNLKAEYDKKHSNVQIGARVFTFDNKKISVVSYGHTYRSLYGDWLIAMAKRKKVTSGKG